MLNITRNIFVPICSAVAYCVAPSMVAAPAVHHIELSPIGTYASGIFGQGAAEIVALMQERLRRSRSAGLGDPDDPDYGADYIAAGPALPQAIGDEQDTAIVAARSLLDEVRLLRGTLTAVFQTGQGR